jgi:hypothetical protein
VDAVAAFGDDGDAGTERFQEVEVRAEFFLFGREVGSREKRGVPAAHEAKVVTRERLSEGGGRTRVGVTEFAAGVSGGAHFTEDRVERDVTGEFVEIVVAPEDRIGADETVAVEGGGRHETEISSRSFVA